MPLIEIARTKTKDEAMAALDTWREKYEEVAKKLKPADVLVDGMRGRVRFGTASGSTCSTYRKTCDHHRNRCSRTTTRGRTTPARSFADRRADIATIGS